MGARWPASFRAKRGGDPAAAGLHTAAATRTERARALVPGGGSRGPRFGRAREAFTRRGVMVEWLEIVTALAALAGAGGGLYAARGVSALRLEVAELRGEVRRIGATLDAHITAPGLHR